MQPGYIESQICKAGRHRKLRALNHRIQIMSTKANREKKQQENDGKLAKASASLQQIADSNITPRNIRKIVKDSIIALQDPKVSLAVRAANAISMLDEVAQDPNMSSFARVILWSAVSELESIRE
jgi:uncharacterized protein